VGLLKANVVRLVKDLNGNHVIQKCLTCLAPADNNFIYEAIRGDCVEVATHRHGCCVLQRCIDSATHSQKAMVIDEISRNSLALVQDAFGNYVVQYVLNINDQAVNDEVIRRLSGHIPELSKQKFSSNVVEKCLTIGTQSQQQAIMGEILRGGSQVLKDMLLDSFANYVIQKGLSVSKGNQFADLLKAVRPLVEELQTTPAGQKIAAKLIKKYPSLEPSDSVRQEDTGVFDNSNDVPPQMVHPSGRAKNDNLGVWDSPGGSPTCSGGGVSQRFISPSTGSGWTNFGDERSPGFSEQGLSWWANGETP